MIRFLSEHWVPLVLVAMAAIAIGLVLLARRPPPPPPSGERPGEGVEDFDVRSW